MLFHTYSITLKIYYLVTLSKFTKLLIFSLLMVLYCKIYFSIYRSILLIINSFKLLEFPQILAKSSSENFADRKQNRNAKCTFMCFKCFFNEVRQVKMKKLCHLTTFERILWLNRYHSCPNDIFKSYLSPMT